jgi:biopolymer transport protein ExbB
MSCARGWRRNFILLHFSRLFPEIPLFAMLKNAVLVASCYGVVFGAGLVSAEDAPVPPPSVAAPTAIPAPETALAAPSSEENEEHTYFAEFVDKMEKGGLTMWILLALSVVGLSVIFERAVHLRAPLLSTPGLSDRADVWFREGKYDEICALCRQNNSIIARVILAIIEHRDCPNADIQRIADDIGSREIRAQAQKSYPLVIIATLSPMLGLYGTVIGMIGAFDTVARAGDMGNASILADDIAKALVTTAGGLVVGIPMLGCFHYFRGRLNKHALRLEAEVNELYLRWFLRSGKKADPA